MTDSRIQTDTEPYELELADGEYVTCKVISEPSFATILEVASVELLYAKAELALGLSEPEASQRIAEHLDEMNRLLADALAAWSARSRRLA